METTENPMESVNDSTMVNLQEEYNKTDIERILTLLDKELIGLIPVKTRIREIAALLLIDRLRTNIGLTAGNPGLHMSFTGSPGTGKTTVALKIADILLD
jgi:ATP-dependent Lon protease